MAKKIRATDSAPRSIRDTSAAPPRVAPATVAAALGADTSAQMLREALAPITLMAIRAELLDRLQSSGGRPALSGTSRRAKIPLGDAEWSDLEALAAAVSGSEARPSAGQIASVLLSLSVRTVKAQLAQAAKPDSSPLARDLAARAATHPARRRAGRNS